MLKQKHVPTPALVMLDFSNCILILPEAYLLILIVSYCNLLQSFSVIRWYSTHSVDVFSLLLS